MQGKNIAVIGAGVSGLAAAYRLQQKGAKVTVFDKRDYVGGRTRSVRIGEFTFDVGALVMLPTYKNVYGLIKELGIEGHIHETKPSLAIIRNGQRHSFDYAHPYQSAITTKLLSWPSKLKLLKLIPELIRYRSRLNYDSMGEFGELDAESTRDYCLRVLNEEIDDYFANPFIRINSLTDTRRAPAGEWLWQLVAYQSPHIFQLDKGMVFYAESLASSLDVRLNTTVTKVTTDNGKATLQIGSESSTFDACLLAVPPPAAHAISASLSPQQEKFFASVKPVYMISLHLGLRKKPDIADSIIMFPEKEHADLLDILLDHNKGPGRAPPGKAAIAIQSTIEWSEKHANASDEEITATLIKLAEPYIGKVDGLIEVSYVHRWDYVCAITQPGFFTMLGDYMKARDLNQPLFFSGDFTAGGIEGATTSGLNAAKHIETFLT
jgi:protoporphyrinogen/coproporphyrinogen III oxidase